MPIGDYQVESEHTLLPPGNYSAIISNVSGTIDDKHYVDIKYLIMEGDFKDKTVQKRYYITPKTLEKFLPWQFGIIGIWHEVKAANSFAEGVEVSTELLTESLGKNDYIVDITVEGYVNSKQETKQKNNIVVVENLGDRVEKSLDQKSFDDQEEIPF